MFLLSWLPYAISSTIQMFSYTYELSPLTLTLASNSGKTFLIWTPISFILFNTNVRETLRERFWARNNVEEQMTDLKE